MKNSALEKLEKQATVYFTLSMMLSLSIQFISDYLGIPFVEYAMIIIVVVLMSLGIINVNKCEKHKGNKSCSL